MCPFDGWNDGWKVDVGDGNWEDDTTITATCVAGNNDITTAESTTQALTTTVTTQTTSTQTTTISTTSAASICPTVILLVGNVKHKSLVGRGRRGWRYVCWIHIIFSIVFGYI